MNDNTQRLFLSILYVLSFVFLVSVPYAGGTVYASGPESMPESYPESVPESSVDTPENIPEDIPEHSADTPDISVEPPSDRPVLDDLPSEDRPEDSLSSGTAPQTPREPEVQTSDSLPPDTPDADFSETELPVPDDSSADVLLDEDLSAGEDGPSDDLIQMPGQSLIPDTFDMEEPDLLFFDKDFADYTVTEGLLLLIFVVLFCGFCISMTAKIMNWRMY